MDERDRNPDKNDPRYSKEARRAYKQRCKMCRDTGLWDKVQVVRCPCGSRLNPESPFWPDVAKWV
jgi:hypothetical protein